MTMHWAALTILIIATGIFIDNQSQARRLSEAANLDSLSRNFLIYRSAVTEFSKSNPGFDGIPDDSALNFPTWFVKPTGVASYISAGASYTYLNDIIQPGLPSRLVELTQSMAIGVNNTGILVSPYAGPTGITVPGAVPYGSIVAVN
jgi:hypothetical protein